MIEEAPGTQPAMSAPAPIVAEVCMNCRRERSIKMPELKCSVNVAGNWILDAGFLP